MKSFALSLMSSVVGNSVIGTGIAVKSTGTAIRKAGETIEVGGAIVEAKGRQIKADYAGQAEAAKAVENAKREQDEQKRHEARMAELEQAAHAEIERHQKAMSTPPPLPTTPVDVEVVPA